MWTRRWALGTSRAVAWLAAGTVPLLSAGFVNVISAQQQQQHQCTGAAQTRHLSQCDNPHLTMLATSASLHDANPTSRGSNKENRRLKQTAADFYYAKHQMLPLPSVMHAALPVDDDRCQSEKGSKNVLVIGDVHGCMDELRLLLDTAVKEHNDGQPFEFVVLVGDLCNKGPYSAQVIRWARTTPNVWSVRGNHDDGALAAALGDAERRSKKKYQWVLQGEEENESVSSPDDEQEIVLSDDDVEWLVELPYTITIPGSYLEQDADVLIVHAGLIPGISLNDQSISTMITIREVLPICHGDSDKLSHFEYSERQKGHPAQATQHPICNVPAPWASVWKGPQQVVFGHDARRGFQRYDHAIGLDSGAVYGKSLTGMILPGKKIVSVPSQQYSKVSKRD